MAEKSIPTTEELQDTYGFHGEHSEFTLADWQHEVSEGNVRSGYWDWVVSSIEREGS